MLIEIWSWRADWSRRRFWSTPQSIKACMTNCHCRSVLLQEAACEEHHYCLTHLPVSPHLLAGSFFRMHGTKCYKMKWNRQACNAYHLITKCIAGVGRTAPMEKLHPGLELIRINFIFSSSTFCLTWQDVLLSIVYLMKYQLRDWLIFYCVFIFIINVARPHFCFCSQDILWPRKYNSPKFLWCSKHSVVHNHILSQISQNPLTLCYS